jgi:hypothetical protein
MVAYLYTNFLVMSRASKIIYDEYILGHKQKVKGKVVPLHYTMKTYWGVAV